MNSDQWDGGEDSSKAVKGSMNVTEQMGSPTVVTRGHYYNLDNENSDWKMPKIEWVNGDSSDEEDDTFIGVEKYSGVPLIWKQRSFYNLLLSPENSSELFDKTDETIVMPLAYVKREYEWS